MLAGFQKNYAEKVRILIENRNDLSDENKKKLIDKIRKEEILDNLKREEINLDRN